MVRITSRFTYALFVLAMTATAQAALSADSPTTQTQVIQLEPGVTAELGVPVIVTKSEVGEKRWGHHQFVTISEYPGSKILLRHHAGADAVAAYGTPSPTYLSDDQGQTWKPFKAEGLPLSGQTYPLLNGDFICMPMAKPFDAVAAGITMPEPVGTSMSYSNWTTYLVSQCAEPIQQFMKNYEAVRWSPDKPTWKTETVTYETSGALVWSPETKPPSRLLSRTCFERPPLPVGDELLFADYRSNFIQDDGSIPRKWGITCMSSRDNGRSWQRKSTIALDRDGKDSLTEPMLARAVNGDLVCIIRRADHDQKPMCITWSSDNGKTWEPYQSLDKMGQFGVFPALISLDCGVMVMSYGRPGIYLTFSTNGQGRDWTEPHCMLQGDAKKLMQYTDGYTSMLALDKNTLLLAYTDFEHRDENGDQRKAILVRTLTINGK